MLSINRTEAMCGKILFCSLFVGRKYSTMLNSRAQEHKTLVQKSGDFPRYIITRMALLGLASFAVAKVLCAYVVLLCAYAGQLCPYARPLCSYVLVFLCPYVSPV